MTDAVFDAAVAVVLDHEGGYSNDPADPGSETNFGISKRQYPDLDIKSLTREKAVAIYRTDYWSRYRIGQLPGVRVPVKVFDSLVNIGPGAIRLLQEALRDGGAQLDVDGRIGPQTVAACRAADTDAVLTAYRARLKEHYASLIEKNPALARFETGWMRRALA